ncbi:MAG TPA: SpoIIE family protein phosphatase [Pseudothermotoga sp.]|nr:SpoIIE family protein phosphatase [Pseudothermotoga sp.]
MLTCQIDFAKKSKEGEEICGDSISIKRDQNKVAVSVSDGLGSGVKASILSTLTTSMATTMLFNGVPVNEVFSSILATLPVCKIRGISYANLCSVVFDAQDSTCSIVEYEFPVTLYFRNKNLINLERRMAIVEAREISISKITPSEGDLIFITTDGVSQAGMGTENFPLGFGLKNIIREINVLLQNNISPKNIVEHLIKLTRKLDRGTRGDDALAAVVQFKKLQVINLFVGPPQDRSKDEELVKSFMHKDGKKVVCGGTTAQIFEKVLKRKVELDLRSFCEDLPPIGKMEGIDLVTEGIVTLTHVFRYLSGQQERLVYGANALAEMLLEADQVNFFVGRAINPAHQNPLFSHDISLKFRLIHDIAQILKENGKIVNLEYF